MAPTSSESPESVDSTAAETGEKRTRKSGSSRGRRSRSRGKRKGEPKALPEDTGGEKPDGKADEATPEALEEFPSLAPKGPKRILIDSMDAEELRIAVMEGDSLEELYYERAEDKKYLGNIYKGRIVNIEPAIQAAFVELGIGRNGFLHVSDVLPIYAGAEAIPIDSLSKKPTERSRQRIQDILRTGQEILVQISKDAIGGKGPSLTTYISIPGKSLVLMPGVSRFGVSKRIEDRAERAKLRENLSKLDPPKGLGFIIRTAGKTLTSAALAKDLQMLSTTWEEIREKILTKPAPLQVRQESDLLTRALRDVCSHDVVSVVANDEATHLRVQEILRDIMPQAEKVAKQYTGTLPLFTKFRVEDQIDKIYNRRIPLPSGGYLIVEQTEALVAIDVNSGKYTDEEDLEETALKINLESTAEVARQLRLRDLGGVIVNDFIDMVQEENRRKVEKAFRAALKRDRAKCWVSRISRFGIIEMTRQRVRPSLEWTIYEPCRHCQGRGMVKSVRTTGTAVLRQLRVALATRKKDLAEVTAHPEVQTYLLNRRRRQILELEDGSSKSIVILADPNLERDEFSIHFK